MKLNHFAIYQKWAQHCKSTMHACIRSYFSCARLFVTLWTIACQASLSMGFSRRECWNGLPCRLPGDLPDPGIKPVSPALQADSLLSDPWGKPIYHVYCSIIYNSQDVETIHTSNNRWIDKENVEYANNGMLFSIFKKGNPTIWDTVDGPRSKYYVYFCVC